MAEGWHKAAKSGLCSQCDAEAFYYHKTEFPYDVGGVRFIHRMIVFRCERHTVKPFHPVREPAKDE